MRVAVVVASASGLWTLSGISGLVVLKTTDSEFHGFPRDRYTTLAETTDRMLATEVSARWRHDGTASFEDARSALLRRSPAITRCRCNRPCTRWGQRCSRIVRACRRSGSRCPTSTTSPWTCRRSGSTNENEVFHADDRPYGLIEGTVLRDDASDPGPLWDPYPLV